METIKKIGNYIKYHKFYLAVMLIGSIMLWILMNQVVLYADDLTLGVVAKTGLSGAIAHLIDNYMNWGGGPTPFIAIVFLMMNLNVWKLFNCAIIVISILLVVRMVTHQSKINKGIIAMILWIGVYILNIYFSREAIYWLDGSLAYLLTAFQMLLYFYYLYSRLVMKTKQRKYDFILLPLVAFFAGWTGPQAGALTVILSVFLLLWVKYRNKEKIKPIYWISCIIGILGFLVYYLAPGNNGRLLEGFPEIAQYNLFEKILYRADSVWGLLFNFQYYKYASIPFFLFLSFGLMGLIGFHISRKEENKRVRCLIKTMSILMIVFLLCIFAIGINYNPDEKVSNLILNFQPLLQHVQEGTFRITMLVPYAITSLVMLASVIVTYYISYSEKKPFLFLLFLGALLAQGMMLLAPYSPLRSAFITIFLLWFVIASLLKTIGEKKISIIWIVSLLLAIMYHIALAGIMIMAYLIFRGIYQDNDDKNSKTYELTIISTIFIIIAGVSYLNTLNGYDANKQIYQENIEAIQEFKKQENQNTLFLKVPEKGEYGFTPFVGIQWIEEATKQYFELENDVILKKVE